MVLTLALPSSYCSGIRPYSLSWQHYIQHIGQIYNSTDPCAGPDTTSKAVPILTITGDHIKYPGRTYGKNTNTYLVYISLFLLTIFGHIYYGPRNIITVPR